METVSFIPHPYSSLKECTAWRAFCVNANGVVKLKGIIVWVVFILGFLKTRVKTDVMMSKNTLLRLFFVNTFSFRYLKFNFQCFLLFYKETVGGNACLSLS